MLFEKFFEQTGKLFFSKISPLFFYILILCPICITSVFLILQYMNLQELEKKFSDSCKKGKIALERKERKEKFLKRYTLSNPYFLDEQIESLRFLQTEQKELETLLKHPALSDGKTVQGRLSFITGEENRLKFTEETIRTSSFLKETEEKQRHPVQMDETDIKKLLTIIEDIPIDSFSPHKDSPQIIITDFHFEKKETSLKTNVVEVDIQLLKREFLK